MTTTKKYEVFLQPFSEKITDDLLVEFTCSKCKEKVVSTPKVQAALSSGGIGHKCHNCESYLALVCCPSCKANLTVDDEEWEELAGLKGSQCPACGVSLYRVKWATGATIASSGILCPGLKNWSSTEIESSYLDKVRRKLHKNNKNLFSVLHHSVGTRMISSKESMEYLLSNKWYSPLVMSNTSSPIKDRCKYKSPFDHGFHSNLFSFINNLRSALDMLSQEICFHFSPTTPEEEVDLFCVHKYLPDNQIIIKQLITALINDESFLYLNKLRNLMQHRRLPLMVTTGSYNTDQLDTIKPQNIHSLALIELPKNLDYFDDNQLHNNFSIPLLNTIENLYQKIENRTLEIYKNINP
ncbi:MAG: hypothetical protein OEL83_07540 [Desulforhopalus sp.]|nr:hypothetical protein [Desulforhopalus sp.]